MIDFKTRSLQKELLDKDDIPFADIRQNMMELNIINTLLGGHSITIKGVKALLIGTNTTPIICVQESRNEVMNIAGRNTE